MRLKKKVLTIIFVPLACAIFSIISDYYFQDNVKNNPAFTKAQQETNQALALFQEKTHNPRKSNALSMKIRNANLIEYGAKNFEEFKIITDLVLNNYLKENPEGKLEAQVVELAIMSNNLEKMKALIQRGADINEKNPEGGMTTISNLILYSHKIFNFDPTAIAELLLQNGADPTIKNLRGNNAIEYAKFFNMESMLNMFEKYGYK